MIKRKKTQKNWNYVDKNTKNKKRRWDKNHTKM